MARQSAKAQPFHARFGDAFVILSVTLLSLASGAWLITNLGLELSSAMLASLAIYCVLLLLHLLVRRTFAADEDEDEGDGALGGDSHWNTDIASQRFEAALKRSSLNPARPAPQAEPDQARSASKPGAWPEPLPMPMDSGEPAPAADPSPPDPFTFRPARSLYFTDDADADPGLSREPLLPAEPAASSPEPELPEMNVEHIQELIKKLADELNGTSPPETSADPEPAPAGSGSTEAMIGRSVEALETTARTMRESAAGAPARTGEKTRAAEAGASPPPLWRPSYTSRSSAPPALDARLAQIAQAIEAERIEVLLEPIQSLAEGRAHHYEVSIRLRTADGTTLEQGDLTRLAEGSGLMPRIDAARMMRAARVARRLRDRGRHGSVLTAATGQSLADDAFLDAALVQPGADGRISLVLSFAQADVRTFTPVHSEAIGSMAAAGFGFALEDVTDLDMDFGRLKAMGFEFVKLDARVFLEGLPAPDGRVPASDICRYLSEFGLAVIVGRIEDDWLLARIMGFGVLLGKGTLFGGAKLVKAEVVADRGTAAA
jgi:cyclic-di-GMP phosphodiesterase TipF (flagellum assembly factor)